MTYANYLYRVEWYEVVLQREGSYQDKYRNKLIPNATTQEQAVEGALDAMITLKEDDPHHLSEL